MMELLDAARIDSGWLEEAARFPVAFAQVREDALIDQWIAGQLPEKAHGLMIASGGCTAALLAAGGHFGRLILADINPAQIDLTRLKLAMVSDCTPAERFELLGHLPLPTEARKALLLELMGRYEVAVDRFGPIDAVVAVGLDQAGRYEWLFRRLREVIGDNDRDRPDDVQRLERAFAEVMTLPNLVRLFGEAATQNAVMPFAEHFFRQTRHALQTSPAVSNPWLAQLLVGRFEAAAYPWLDLPQQPIATEIDYRQGAMADVLNATDERFDFIHLSNILDWLTPDEAAAVLGMALARLRPGGWVIVRQLNSALDIPALGQGFDWQAEIAADWHRRDRSFFYQSLHIGRPCA